METDLIELNYYLNKKLIDYNEIQGTCNKSEIIKQQFNKIIKYKDKYDYYVTLISVKFN